MYGNSFIRSWQMSTKDGLANNTINDIYQDSNGFIWIGSFNGLHRYDGRHLTVFQPNLKDSITLTDHRVLKITEDKKGHIWVTTADERFSCFDVQKECFVDFTGNGTLNAPYHQILIDSKQDVWLWNNWQNGCLHVQEKDGRFSSVKYDMAHGNLYNDKVNFLKEDKNGIIWIGTQEGVTKIEDGKAKLIKGRYNFIKIYFYEDQTYFVGREGTLGRLAENDSIVSVYSVPSPDDEYISSAIQREHLCYIFTNNRTFIFDFSTYTSRIAEDIVIPFARTFTDNKNNYWVYNGTGYVWYIPCSPESPAKCFRFMEPDMLKFIDVEKYFMLQDSRGLLWITTLGNGLFVYNPQTDELTHYLNNQKENIVDSDFLNVVMEDSAGDVWIGSEYAGLHHLSIIGEGLIKIKPDTSSSTVLSNQIRVIAPSDGNGYWVSNNNGELFLYDSSFRECIRKDNYISAISTIQYDDNHTLFLGSHGNGIRIGDYWYKEDNPSNRLTKLMYISFLSPRTNEKRDPNSLVSNYISTLYKDREGRMWGGTWGRGLVLVKKEKDKYLFETFLNKGDVSAKQIQSILEDRSGWIWVGTKNGIYTFYPDSLLADPNNYHFFSRKNSSLRDNDILAIYEDHAGNIWLGTSGSGVSMWTPSGTHDSLELIHYDTTEGLSSNEFQAFIEDGKYRLWISTKNGLTCYTPEAKTFDKLYLSTTPKGDMYTSAACKGPDGTLLFGTNDGIISIDPDKVLNRRVSNKPCFTSLLVNNMVVKANDSNGILSHAIEYCDRVELAYDQNTFTVQFSNLDFFEPGKSYYCYKLKNYDNRWSEPSDVGQASYKNLPPGEYTLNVRACNSVGIWCDAENSLRIIINPPFWATAWAYAVYTVLVILLLYIAFRLTHKFISLRQHVQIERKLTDFKLQFFTNIAHEFRTPLTLIQGGMEKLEQISVLPDEALIPIKSIRRNSNRLMQLVEQLLMFRKIQNNKLKLAIEEIDVVAFCKEIFLTFQETAMSRHIIFRFIPFSNSHKMYIDQGFLDKILYNLLSNAFKFTPDGGEIQLTVSKDEEQERLIIRVIDTGIGIPKEKRNELFKRFAQINPSSNSFGIGLHLTHELVIAHHGNIEYADNDGRGSVFLITLPLGKESYQVGDFVSGSYLTEKKNEKYIKYDMLQEMSSSMPLNDIKVLIIDDDDDIRGYVQGIMKKYFMVKAVSNAGSGLEQMMHFGPDIVLCDVLMPDMTGYDFVKQIKKDKSTSHIPVILLTSLSEDDDKVKAYECGADDFITKPFSVRLLLTRIINIIEQRMELQEKFGKEEISTAKKLLLSNDQDKKFIDRMNTVIENNLADTAFDVDTFAAAMGYKRTVFYQKVSTIVGITPNEYLRNARLKKAADLLLDDRLNVAEVAYQVGFADPSYFGKCFKSYYGMSPSHFQHKRVDEN